MPELSGMIQEFLEGSIHSIGGRQPVIQSKNITENGTYTAPSGVDGFNPVVVNVQSQEPNIESKSIFENGTYNVPSGVDGFNPVVVDVPLPQNAYLLKSVANLPQAIASFNDGEEMVMPSLKVAIEPQQEGSGDPSPTNIRPISGWSEVDVVRDGKNLVDISANNEVKVNGNPPREYANGGCAINVTSVGAYYVIWEILSITENMVGTTFVLSGEETSDRLLRFATAQSWSESPTDYAGTTLTINNTMVGKKLGLMFYNGTGAPQSFVNGMVEIDTTATTYEAYAGTTYTIDLGGTRYGGEVDVVSGVLTLTDGFISSYNGETLPSTWISDRDVYAEGTTPTTGAEVCYKLATPQTIQLTPTAVKSLLGQNNIWADTGDITDAEYFSK